MAVRRWKRQSRRGVTHFLKRRRKNVPEISRGTFESLEIVKTHPGKVLVAITHPKPISSNPFPLRLPSMVGVTGGTKFMSLQYTLNVSPRANTGRSASRRLRKVNQVPAILYGKHTNPETLAVDGPEFTRLIKAIAGKAALVELKRNGGANALSFLQEVQRDPITDRFLHVDLQEVKADEKMEIRVRISLTGESFGVKNQSGVLETPSLQLRIRCLPKDLPPLIEVDVTNLKVGETIHVGELKSIPGVEFLDDKNQPVVSCVEPVAEEVAATPAPGAAAAAPAAGAAAAPAAGAAAPAAGAAAAPAAGAKAAAPAAGAKPAAPAKK
jgi:large subunit ribosomal protein L25